MIVGRFTPLTDDSHNSVGFPNKSSCGHCQRRHVARTHVGILALFNPNYMNLIETTKQKLSSLMANQEVKTAMSHTLMLVREGKISDEDALVLLSGLQKTTINIQSMSVDNSVNNSVNDSYNNELSSGARIISGNDQSVEVTQSELNGISSHTFELLNPRMR
jgi:hypothetical protein